MKSVQSFILFYILVGFLLQILGDFKLNRYVRFYGGLIFVLLLLTPIYELFTKEDVALNINLKQVWQEYEDARNYDLIMGNYGKNLNGQAAEVLIEEMNNYLNGEGYEIEEYHIEWSEEYNIETLELYVVALGELGIPITMENTTENALRLKNLLQETYGPEFELEVYSSE